ncbi:hypothetical protein [Streptomyces sp. NPDC046909]|uniref:hypothetical protein n=1 Tax=Streptomyces sp. NPDC046909 TaxID=3155617 RepID=UPI0033FEC927
MVDTEWVDEWHRVMTGHLAGLVETFEETHGYPPGENTVVPAHRDTRAAAARLAKQWPAFEPLLPLYEVVGSASLEDVDHAYFIHSPATVTQHLSEYGHVDLADGRTGIVFASDGGGHLYALADDGRVEKSRTASWSDDFAEVSEDIGDFLGQLLHVVRQFAGP